jgi:hypothetical protein
MILLIALGVAIVPTLSMAAVDCDFVRLRHDNQMADLAASHIEKGENGFNRLFKESMNRVIAQNRRGCRLPSSDPDSVLFRPGASGLTGRNRENDGF